MSYELSELITMFRQDMMDEVEPYLWSDLEITRYFAEVQDYFLENTGGVLDTESIPFTASALSVAVPDYVLQARTAWDANEKPLTLKDKADWDNEQAGRAWRSETGVPNTLITDLDSNLIRLFPIPIEDGTLNLDVRRVSKESPEETDELEVIDRNAQRILLIGARALGYQKEDPETLDSEKSDKYRADFAAKTSGWFTRIQNARRRTRTVAYGGI